MLTIKLVAAYIKHLIKNSIEIPIDIVMELEEDYFFSEDDFAFALEFIGVTNHWFESCEDSSNDVYTYYEFDCLQTFLNLWDKIEKIKNIIPVNIYDRLINFDNRYVQKHNQYYAMAFQCCMLDNYYDSKGKAKGIVFWSEAHEIVGILVLTFLIAFIDYINTSIPILKCLLRKSKKGF